MPNKKNYKSILKNPDRYDHYLDEKRKSAVKHRLKHPFKRMCNRLLYEKKMEGVKPFDLWVIVKRQKMLCPFSKEKLTTENISVDHITPLAKGGKNDLTNIQFTTKHVNIAKFTMTHKEFIEFCHKIASLNPL